MPHQKNSPEKNKVQTEEKKTSASSKQSEKKAPTPSPRKVVNLFMVIILLIIVAGLYLYQKGYVTHYYPLIKTKLTGRSSLDATVAIPQGDPVQTSESLRDNDLSPQDTPDEKGVDIPVQEDIAIPVQEDIAIPDQTDAAPVSQDEASSQDQLNEAPENVENKTPSLPSDTKIVKDLQDRLSALEEKFLALSASPLLQKKETDDKAKTPKIKTLLYALSSINDLENRFHQALPFTNELTAMKNFLDPEDYATLAEYASIGVPNLPYLIKTFKKIERLLKEKEAVDSSATFLERSWAFLTQLVHLERVTSFQKEAYESTESGSYKLRLRNGDVDEVIKELEDLKVENKDLILWLEHAKTYDTAHKIIRKTKQALFQSNL